MPIQKELKDVETQTEEIEIVAADHSGNEQARQRTEAASTVNPDQNSTDNEDLQYAEASGSQSSSLLSYLLNCIGQMFTREKGLCNNFFVL